MIDLDDQLRTYFDTVDPPFEADQLMRQHLAEASRARIVAPRRGLTIAAAAALLVVALVGLPLLLGGGSPSVVVDESTTLPPTTSVEQPVNGTEDVAITSDGSLWHGFLDGLRRWDLTTGRVTVYTELDGLPSRDTHLVGVGPDDTLWVISGGHLVSFDGTWTVVSIPELEELTEWGSNVGALEIAPNGDVLLAVGRDRLIRYDGSDTTLIESPELVSSDPWAGSLAVAPDGTIWAVLEFDSGVASYDGDSWTVYDEQDGVPWLASNIEVADDGTVWVGTTSTWGPPEEPESGRPADGIARFDGINWTTFTTSDGLLSNSGSVIIAPDETVWVLHSALPDSYAQEMGISSPPPGLSRLDGTTWTSVSGEDQGGGPGVITHGGTVWTVEPDSITGFRDGGLITFTLPDGAIPPEPPEEPSSALPYEYPATGSGTVTVHVSGIEGAEGWRATSQSAIFSGSVRQPRQLDTLTAGGFLAIETAGPVVLADLRTGRRCTGVSGCLGLAFVVGWIECSECALECFSCPLG
jgi:sugar lactone lactonase YvrE